MNQLILLIPFAIALLTSVVSKKISYISLIISSLILGVYAIIYTGINELTFFYLIASIVIIVSS